MLRIGFIALLSTLAVLQGLPARPESSPAVQPQSVDPILRFAPITQARSRPNTNICPARVKSGSVAYVVHHYLDHGEPVLIFDVPRTHAGFLQPPCVNNLGFDLMVSYPSGAGIYTPRSHSLLSCSGWCVGQVLANVQNRYGDNVSIDRIYRDRIKWTGRQETLDKFGVYDKATRIVMPPAPQFHIGVGVKDQYIKQKDGKVTAFIQCEARVPSPGCNELFAVGAIRGVWVNADFNMRDLSRWPQIKTFISDLLTAWYAGAATNPKKGGV